MAGKHRISRQRKTAATRRWAPGLVAAAITATSLTAALTTGTTVTVSPAIELIATITPASSTAQVIASPTFYGYDYTQTYGEQATVPFFFGPQGIVTAIRNNEDDPLGNAVLSSGWGAGQTGTALGRLRNDSALDDVKLVILDNNSNRAAGGFWTTYWVFAPLLLTSSEPTPNDLDVPVLDVGYDYNINGNAPTYPANLVALANSLVAYVYGYAGQSDVQLPADVAAHLPENGGDPADLTPGTHYVVDSEGNIIEQHDNLPTNITYVTVKSDRLPLVKPLLLIPVVGKIVADGIEPVLTVLVNAGYKDNDPIPDDPSQQRKMGLVPVSETVRAIQQLPGAVSQGIENVRNDLSGTETTSTNLVQPSNNSRTVNVLAGKPQAPAPLAQPEQQSGSSPNNAFSIEAVKPDPSRKTPASSSSNGTKNPLQQAIRDFRSDVREAVNNLVGGQKKPASTATPSDTGAPSNPSAGTAAPSN